MLCAVAGLLWPTEIAHATPSGARRPVRVRVRAPSSEVTPSPTPGSWGEFRTPDSCGGSFDSGSGGSMEFDFCFFTWISPSQPPAMAMVSECPNTDRLGAEPLARSPEARGHSSPRQGRHEGSSNMTGFVQLVAARFLHRDGIGVSELMCPGGNIGQIGSSQRSGGMQCIAIAPPRAGTSPPPPAPPPPPPIPRPPSAHISHAGRAKPRFLVTPALPALGRKGPTTPRFFSNARRP
jgi:hypothetical protein